MALRQIQLSVPIDEAETAQRVLEGQPLLYLRVIPLGERTALISILLDAAHTEAVMDLLDKRFGSVEGFRVVLLAVEATLPRPPPEPPPPEPEVPAIPAAPAETSNRISREELRSQIEDATKLTRVYLVMAALSSVVAAIGLLTNNVAVIIGAMVIAPLLGPNMGLALGATLGDLGLARRAFSAGSAGSAVVLLLALGIGVAFPVDPHIPEIASRTYVGFGDIALALASGAAGALAFTTAVSAALVGVMVAVALVPPLVTFGLLLGSGYLTQAWGAFGLLAGNVICVNLAGVVTFLIQGIRPRMWWEADRARKATRIALVFWAALLIALIFVIRLLRA